MPLHIRAISPSPGTPGEGRGEGFCLLSSVFCLLLLLSSCRQQPTKPESYSGPTESLSKVISEINANNRSLPTLYARHDLEANIIDTEKKKSHFVNGSGELFLRKPNELLLRGRKDIAGKLFEMGSTLDRFWFTDYLAQDTMWWGTYRNIGKPCAQELPIHPYLIGEVLGISDVNTNLLEPPVPTLRFNNDLDVYMLIWSQPLPDRWIALKEIWYDRKTYRPRKVILHDENGRVILRANLANHQPVEVEGLPRERWPTVAASYDLFFPDTKSTMTLRLREMALVSKTGHPREGTIVFREDADVSKVIQLDADCKE